jgi:hypothetical protein
MSRFRNLFHVTLAAALTSVAVSSADAQTAPRSTAASASARTDAAEEPDLLRTGVRHFSSAYCQPTPNCPTTPGTKSPGTPQGTSDPGTSGMGGAPDTPNLFAGADAGPTAGLGGYIDNAVPASMLRFRFDSAYRNNRPDRASFFYAKCGCFATPAGGSQLDAHGPPLPETSVDYQALYSYLEFAIDPRLSVFVNAPVRFINPDQNANAHGWGDLSFGGKYAFVSDQTRVLSLQLQVIVPTGREELGLGSGVTWLEPGLLYQEQLCEAWQVFGQLKDQMYLTRPSDFTGNVLTYGLGTSYVVANGCWGYLAPVGEIVGWSVLSGKELDPARGAVPAHGDTIVNGKIGLRIGFGAPTAGQPYQTRSDLYIGYGRALTGEVWYKDMFRIEYRLLF